MYSWPLPGGPGGLAGQRAGLAGDALVDVEDRGELLLGPALRIPVRHLAADLPVVNARHGLFLLLVERQDETAGQVVSSSLRSRSAAGCPARPAATGPCRPMPPGSALVILTIDFARRAGGAMHVGQEALADALAEHLLAHQRVGHPGRLQPAARGRLVRAGAEHRLVVGARILGQPVRRAPPGPPASPGVAPYMLNHIRVTPRGVPG